ncbi:MAG: fatty acid hydroxylase family protein, partial [Burkholderiaceae bacterium]
MITEKQARFRDNYLQQISPWYHGLLHIGVMYGAGIAAIAWCVSQLTHPTWEWLLIIPIAIAGNFVEWGMHMHIMHRLKDVFALRAIFDRHTRQHHQYFTDNDYTISSVKEFRIVFFPWRVLIVLVVASALFGSLAALLLGPDAGYMFPITMIGHYMVYETFHF